MGFGVHRGFSLLYSSVNGAYFGGANKTETPFELRQAFASPP